MGRKARIEVTERALQVPVDLLRDPRYAQRLQNPFGEPSMPVQLKRPGWRPRWFNAAIMADKVFRAKAKGWDAVTEADVVDPQQLGYYVKAADGSITRGERGQEVLMMIPEPVYSAIEQAKAAHNLRNINAGDRTKQEIVNAAGQQYGDEAAAFLDGSLQARPVGQVTDQYERIERTGDDLDG